jgi:hypothetical protein
VDFCHCRYAGRIRRIAVDFVHQPQNPNAHRRKPLHIEVGASAAHVRNSFSASDLLQLAQSMLMAFLETDAQNAYVSIAVKRASLQTSCSSSAVNITLGYRGPRCDAVSPAMADYSRYSRRIPFDQ